IMARMAANAVRITGRARLTVASTIASPRVNPCFTSDSIWSTRITALRMVMPQCDQTEQCDKAERLAGKVQAQRGSDDPKWCCEENQHQPGHALKLNHQEREHRGNHHRK